MLQLHQDKLDILRIHISIRVLLTPGTTTPIDIKNPDKIRNPLVKSFTLLEKSNLFSIITNKQPKIKAITVKNKYRNL